MLGGLAKRAGRYVLAVGLTYHCILQSCEEKVSRPLWHERASPSDIQRLRRRSSFMLGHSCSFRCVALFVRFVVFLRQNRDVMFQRS